MRCYMYLVLHVHVHVVDNMHYRGGGGVTEKGEMALKTLRIHSIPSTFLGNIIV